MKQKASTSKLSAKIEILVFETLVKEESSPKYLNSFDKNVIRQF